MSPDSKTHRRSLRKTVGERRTQEQRRTETRGLVLDAAIRLFGERGYAHTSLDDIAAACGLTIRPVYHYYGNKKELFAAVNDAEEMRLTQHLTNAVQACPDNSLVAGWNAFVALSSEPGFRQIVLIDSPNILGRDRWSQSPVIATAKALLSPNQDNLSTELLMRMMIGACAEAALMLAEHADSPDIHEKAGKHIEMLLRQLSQALLV